MIMKTSNTYKSLLTLAVAATIAITGCSSVTNDVESLTEQDLEMAAQVVGASMSDTESGVTSSLYDAFSVMDNAGLPFNNGILMKDDHGNRRPGSGRGFENNFSYSYDPETGTHTRSFRRQVQTPNFTKSVSVLQEMIFTSVDDTFLQYPRMHRDSIETISYVGNKSGSTDGPVRNSNFTKIDTMLIGGIHSSSNLLTINGSHRGFGDAEAILRDSTEMSRNYEISIGFDNVSINKDTVQTYGNMEQGVSGTLSYSLVINRSLNGNADEVVIEGTIDLEEDGTALLRFNRFDKVFRLSLADGEYEETSSGRGNRNRAL